MGNRSTQRRSNNYKTFYRVDLRFLAWMWHANQKAERIIKAGKLPEGTPFLLKLSEFKGIQPLDGSSDWMKSSPETKKKLTQQRNREIFEIFRVTHRQTMEVQMEIYCHVYHQFGRYEVFASLAKSPPPKLPPPEVDLETCLRWDEC